MLEVPTFRRWAVFAVLGAFATAGCIFADEPRGDGDEGDDGDSGGTGWTTPGNKPRGGSSSGGAAGTSTGGTLSTGGFSTGGGFLTGGTSSGGASSGGANPAGGTGPAGGTSAGGSSAGGAGPAGGSPAGGTSTGGSTPTGGTSTGGAPPAGSGPGGAGGSTPTGGTGGSTPTGGTGGSGSGAVMKFCNDLVRGTEIVTLTLVFSGVRATASSGNCTPIVPNACIPIPTGSNPTVALLEGTTEILSGTFADFTVASGDEIFVLATIDDIYMEPTLLADTFELVFGTSCASTDPYTAPVLSGEAPALPGTQSAAFGRVASALRSTPSLDGQSLRPAFRLRK